MAKDEHVALLKKGVEAWNAWRDENRNIQPELGNFNQRANLIGADLSGANLRGTKLNWANLQLANLNRADLSEANLSGADLFPGRPQRCGPRQGEP
jgi:hypothetical protein